MFNDLVESSRTRQATQRPWTVTVSLVIQLFFLAILVLIPLIYTNALPKALLGAILTAPTPPHAAGPAPIRVGPATNQSGRRPQVNIFMQPPTIPIGVNMTSEPAPAPDMGAAPIIGATGDNANGVRNGVSESVLGIGTPPAAPPVVKPNNVRVVRPSNVQQAKLIVQPLPVYPLLAREAGVQGSVVLHAIISKDGRVEELTVIAGNPMLIQAARDAVLQWRYQPTLLNNEPVEVDTTITVVFTMAGN